MSNARRRRKGLTDWLVLFCWWCLEMFCVCGWMGNSFQKSNGRIHMTTGIDENLAVFEDLVKDVGNLNTKFLSQMQKEEESSRWLHRILLIPAALLLAQSRSATASSLHPAPDGPTWGFVPLFLFTQSCSQREARAGSVGGREPETKKKKKRGQGAWDLLWTRYAGDGRGCGRRE
ncbi:hypothetical protein B0T10DRAFT_288170 [Thelonectria olida]|uniref:Uncharacterized protein n=1 Tax=Thelonectria olida TaxID=1576542 RepID=A0A9P8WA38_9HYPO|nr:hypothetical protein B0T10DRAFT_288170 [Thelonectria olida]